MGDYPDYMQSVSRAPTQSLPYQVYGVVSVVDDAIAAGVSGSLIWNIPDDGKNYVLDTVFITWTIKGVVVSGIYIAPNQLVPVWAQVAGSANDYCVTQVLSRQGALSLKYPQSVMIYLTNTNSVARTWSAFINEYSYE